MPNVAPLPRPVSNDRKVRPTTKFDAQLVNVEIAIPKSRPSIGCTSEHSTQISGPAETAKPMMKTSSIATATICISMSVVPKWSSTPNAPKPIAMTANPTNSTGRRPTLSTKAIATKVDRTLTSPTSAVPQSASWPLKPTSAKMRGA